MTDADRKKLLDLADTLQRAGRDLYDTSANAPREVAGPLCAFPVATGSGSVSSAEVNQLRSLLDDANGKLHALQSMMAEAGFPMRIKLGEDLHGNEDWVRVRPECQLRDVLRRLSELTSERQPSPNGASET